MELSTPFATADPPGMVCPPCLIVTVVFPAVPTQCLRNSILPVSRMLVIVQVIAAPAATGTLGRLVAGDPLATDAPAALTHAIEDV